MKKLFLIRNPNLFQGEKYLKDNKNYFEGWYFKHTNKKDNISFIPGINVNGQDKKSFIQIITNYSSYFIDYNISDFEYSFDPFYVKIGNSFFSKDGITINIDDSKQNLHVYGTLKYSNNWDIDRNVFSPNIMGPFSYIPFMEFNHAILIMKNDTYGIININDTKICFDKGIGYIEKDWGISFPKSYIWCQGNSFKNSSTSFMLSIANIPFKFFSFRGIICNLIVDNKEYRFATYNNTKILKYTISNNLIDIELKKGHYLLEIKSQSNNGLKLIAPTNGRMNKDILESISSVIVITLKNNNNVIFSDTSTNCGLEIVI